MSKDKLCPGDLARLPKSDNDNVYCIVKEIADGKIVMSCRVTGKQMVVARQGVERILECNCCCREIKIGREVWLEYDAVTDLFHWPGEVPEGHESRGHFPFGATCARRKLAATESARQ